MHRLLGHSFRWVQKVNSLALYFQQVSTDLGGARFGDEGVSLKDAEVELRVRSVFSSRQSKRQVEFSVDVEASNVSKEMWSSRHRLTTDSPSRLNRPVNKRTLS
jgi:hypothetical protein